MPGMPRLNGKTTRLAYHILGVPPNMRQKRKKEESKVNKRLIFEETSRVR